ncbi:hypothetical protein F2Q69_00035991 [Brassica cretica]|uniref:Uncharacterized protein n=1 Tax=Brassica cretica TaxID=69181 RepID=A0A8S9SFB0_BRACR|nr:hypothetical protein F2Q69_00035991 [Brassica cretica]
MDSKLNIVVDELGEAAVVRALIAVHVYPSMLIRPRYLLTLIHMYLSILIFYM